MFDLEGFLWVAAFVTVSIGIPCLAGILIIGRFLGFRWEEAAGVLLVDDDVVDRILRRVRLRAQAVPLKSHRRNEAEAAIERETCREIVDAFRETYPQQRWRVKTNWPRAVAILHDDGEVSIRLWIGLDHDDMGDGLEPVKVATAWRRKPDATKQIQNAIRRGQETVAVGAGKTAKR